MLRREGREHCALPEESWDTQERDPHHVMFPQVDGMPTCQVLGLTVSREGPHIRCYITLQGQGGPHHIILPKVKGDSTISCSLG